MGKKGGFVTQREVKGVPAHTVSLTMQSQLHSWLKKTVRPKSTHTRTVGREARAHGWGP